MGVEASESSSLIFTNTIIRNAHAISVRNSNLTVLNCRVDVPSNGFGLDLENTAEGYSTNIEASQTNKGFFRLTDTTIDSHGIRIGIMKNPVYISGIVFGGLFAGIVIMTPQYNVVSNCRFITCATGIQLFNATSTSMVEQCIFTSCDIGALLSAAVPLIDQCTFYGMNQTSIGVLSENSIFTFGQQSGICNSHFTGYDSAIVSRNSNLNVKGNQFSGNNMAILSHSASNLKLSSDAFNVFQNNGVNLGFMDTEPYISTIQLVKGHNDFYRNENTNDFSFDDNYYNVPIHDDPTIFADGNWFQDNRVVINDPAYESYVKINEFDPDPNTTLYQGDNRLGSALDYEKQGMFTQAAQGFKAILDDPLDSEKAYLADAVDGVYRMAQAQNDSTWACLAYLDSKITQYAATNSPLCSLLKEYYIKCLLQKKEYQSAIDLIQIRIDNPVNPVDSLLAIMDLEVTLRLAELDETKKPISTKYTVYQYPNMQVYNSKHNEHWQTLNSLLGKGNEEEVIPAPLVAQITSNYPNPFNPSTTIEFGIPADGKVKLSIYNLKGQKVKELLNSPLDRGYHKAVWNGKDKNNRSVSSGVYFVRLEAGKTIQTRKIMLMK